VNDIIAVRYQANSPLPSETELAAQTGVSRLTVREAVKSFGRMRAAAASSDVSAFVAADIAFHQHVMDAAGNSFITSLLGPLSRILQLTRHQTSAHAPVREHAIEHHQRILVAVRRGTPTKAGRAMRGHMNQTEHDMDTYVRDPAASILAIRAGDPPASRTQGRRGATRPRPVTHPKDT
jgi:DNA-binding FadR family transcriptional regulator